MKDKYYDQAVSCVKDTVLPAQIKLYQSCGGDFDKIYGEAMNGNGYFGFHEKWRVPKEAYLECMTAYLNRETEYGWYLCLDGERIVGGLGVIENDFHDRNDLMPNVCAVYTEADCRCQGIAGRLLNMAVDDMRAKGISPLYLVTNHTSFYERYGWEFLCMVQGDGEPEMSRMYIHR